MALSNNDKKWMLDNFVTKKESKNFLTRSDKDIGVIGDLVSSTIDKKVEDGTLASGESVSHLPTKEEHFSKMDEVVTELKKSREEQITLSHRSKVHTDKIEKLEKIHPNYQHSSV